MAQNRHFLMRIGQQADGPGRATKYDPDQHPARVMQLAQAGEFPEAWAADIGVTFRTFRAWVRDHEEFREAFEAARLLLETYWTREIAKNLNNPNARPGLYLLLARRFSYYYGPNAPDLWEWFGGKEDAAGATSPAVSTESQTINGMTSDDLERRLEALRKRREEAEKQ